jgi:predicted Zn-dependent protease with MMP-like domain
MLYEMSLEEFQEVVDQTMDGLPKEFREKLDNVEVLVEIWPTHQDMQSIRAHPGAILFGLYRGVPQTKRGLYYSGVMPDKILIFAGPILSMSQTIEEAKKQIKKTVLHEVGHHFGMSEEDIRKAEH